MIVNSFDEWSPLKEVIVGSPISYEAHELERSFKLFFHDVAYSTFYYPSYESASDKSHSDQENPTRKLRQQYIEGMYSLRTRYWNDDWNDMQKLKRVI